MGYSLVETAVSVAVIGVLAAVAIPSLRGLLPRFRLGNNTSILVNEIALARRQAIAQSIDYSIAFDADAESYTLWKGASGAGVSRDDLLAGSDIVGLSSGFTDATVVFASGAMNVPDVGGAANVGVITPRTPDGSYQPYPDRAARPDRRRALTARWGAG
jgi:Tfp pilus assembly protein FimT